MEIRKKTFSYLSDKNIREHNLEEEIKHLEDIEHIALEKINENKATIRKL